MSFDSIPVQQPVFVSHTPQPTNPPAGTGGKKFDLVTFRADDDGTLIYLKLGSAWRRRCGLSPDVNEAVLSYKEFAKLGGNPARTGSVEFWYSTSPGKGSADVKLQGERIVGVAPLDLRATPDKGVITVEYRLFFADFRERFVDPRGGRLELGLINADQKSPQTSAAQAAPPPTAPEMSLMQLLQACLTVMDVQSAIPDVSSYTAPRDIKWFGNHAPTELGKLLSLCGCVFVPGLDGKGSLAKITTDGSVNLPGGDALPIQSTPNIDRRGKTVIFSSYPTAVIATGTGNGPDPDNWYFVMQDSMDAWVKIENCDLLPAGKDWPTEIRNHFVDVQEKFRDRVASQLYRHIQAPQDIPAKVSPILPRRWEKDLRDYPVQVIAKLVSQRNLQSGQYETSKDKVEVPVVFKNDQDILQLARQLILVNGPTDDPAADFKGPADFTVRYSTEKAHKDQQSGNYLHDYFHAGFSGPGAQQLSEQDCENAIDGANHDAIILTRPQWRLLNVDGEDVNRSDLDSMAHAEAALYLAAANAPTKVAAARGFASVAPSGLVTEVEWDQQDVITRCKLADWYTPDGALDLNHQLRKMEAGEAAAEAYPNQAATQESRTAQSLAGATQPMIPIQPQPEPLAANGSRVALGHVSDKFPNGGFYTFLPDTGDPGPTVAAAVQAGTGGVDMPEGMTEAKADKKAILLCSLENGLKGHRLAIDQGSDAKSYVPALRIGRDQTHKTDIYVALDAKGNRQNPVQMTAPHTGGQTDADTTTWNFDDDAGVGVIVEIMTRMAWDADADQFLGFFRDFSYDALGKLYAISAETKYILTGTTACPIS